MEKIIFEHEISYHEIGEKINSIPLASRWNFIAQLINKITTEVEELENSQKDTIEAWLKSRIKFFNKSFRDFDLNSQMVINAEFLFELKSKQDWVNKVPKILPVKKRPSEKLLFIDSLGNIFETGADFDAAEKLGTYPCRVYRPQNVESQLPKMIKIAIHILEEGHYDECYFIMEGLKWLQETDWYHAYFINFDNEQVFEKKLKAEKVWMDDEWNDIMTCELTIEEFFSAKPCKH